MTGLVLAAGRGERLGGVNKASLRTGGQSFLARIAAVARAAGCDSVAVVVGGPFAEQVRAAAAELGISVVENPHAERGMSSSVARGFAWLDEGDHDSALLWPVDHAFVSEDTVTRVISALPGHRAVIPSYGGRGGHPVAIDRSLFAELATCEGEAQGARTVLRRHAAATQRLELDDPGVLRDVDRPEDRR